MTAWPTVLVALLLLSPVALPGTFSQVLSVPGDAATIQDAVDLAGPDTLIVVAKDTYGESVIITEKTNLTLRGQGRPVIDPGGAIALVIAAGCDGVLVQGFILQNAAIGVDVSASTNVSVTKCLIRDGGAGIVAFDASTVVIEKNTLADLTGNGVDLGSLGAVSGSSVLKNKVDRVAGHGISIAGADNRAEKNKVTQAGLAGVVCAGTGNVLDRNKTTATGDDGLLVLGARSTGNTLTRNKVFQANDEGIRIEGDENTVDGCRVSGTGDEGIELIGTGNLAVNCRVAGAFDDGVLVEGIDNTVRGCRVKGAGGDGVEVRATGNTVETSRSAGAGQDGFHVSGKGHTFTGNRAKGSFDLDLEDENGVEGPNTYEGNVFPKNNIGPGI